MQLWMCMSVCMHGHMWVCKLIPSWGRQMGAIGHENSDWQLEVLSLVSWWPEDTGVHPCMLCNNSSQEYLSLLQMWEATPLFSLSAAEAFVMRVLHTGSSTIQYRQTKHGGHRAAGPAGLSACKSLAPSRCRFSKHTNIPTAVKVV